MNTLAAREESAWVEVERLIAAKRPNDYDRAVLLLVDLRDVAAGSGRGGLFEQPFPSTAARHAAKPSFMLRLREAGLEAG